MSLMATTCPECNKPGSLSEHPECKRERKNRRERERKQARKAQGFTASDLSYRYSAAKKTGLTLATLDALAARPCDVCGEVAAEHRRRNSPAVRKDTGAVVGTTCQRCATALGYLGHDPDRLRAAIALLTSGNDYRETSS